MSEKIKKGKSRDVFFYPNTVIKIPTNNYCELKHSIILGLNGEFENLKEIYLWTIVKKYPEFRKVFANIFDTPISNLLISAERLDSIPIEIFDKFYIKYNILHMYSQINLGCRVLDNHTIENYENFGLDKKGNLKILDYAITSDFIFKTYSIDYVNINIESIKNLKSKMIADIKGDDIRCSSEIFLNIIPLYISLRFYDNNFKFLYYAYKYNVFTLKVIFEKVIFEILRKKDKRLF